MKKSSREKLNLFFSAFLVIGYIICSYFFMTLTSRVSDTVGTLINVAVFVLFGLIVFYATRVSEGVPVKRFSPIVLLVLDLPALLIIVAALAPAFPLHAVLVNTPAVWTLAAIALGYGIPYTFLSGFEMNEEETDVADEVVEGGIAQDLAETVEEIEPEEAEVEEAEAEEVADAEDVAQLEAIDGVEETEETAQEAETEEKAETADAE